MSSNYFSYFLLSAYELHCIPTHYLNYFRQFMTQYIVIYIQYTNCTALCLVMAKRFFFVVDVCINSLEIVTIRVRSCTFQDDAHLTASLTSTLYILVFFYFQTYSNAGALICQAVCPFVMHAYILYACVCCNAIT